MDTMLKFDANKYTNGDVDTNYDRTLNLTNKIPQFTVKPLSSDRYLFLFPATVVSKIVKKL